jgi:chromatin assembly factor 1 subunit B
MPNIGQVGRRESEMSESDRDDVSSTSKKRELYAVPESDVDARESKRRRIAPTPITMMAEGDSAIASTEENIPTQTPGHS